LVSNDYIQAGLDGYIKDGRPDLKVRINGKLFKVPEKILVYTAEIEGKRPDDLTENELFWTVSNKLEIPSGRLVQTHHGVTFNLLVSTKPIQEKEFQKKYHKFRISPKRGHITLTMQNESHREAIRQIVFSEVQQQLKVLGFIRQRTSSGRHDKGLLIEDDSALDVFKSGAFYYHIFNAVNFRIYCYDNESFLLVLDTKRPVLRSSLDRGTLKELLKVHSNWPSIGQMPESIRNRTISIRKCNARERYRRSVKILNKIELPSITSENGKIFSIKIPRNKAKYLRNPTFLFGKVKKTLGRDQPFKSFMLDNLLEYGPYNQNLLPKTIRVKIVRMAQINNRYQEKIIKGISRFLEQFSKMFRIALEVIGPGNTIDRKIITLPETEAEVEEYCHKQLRSQYQAGTIDLVIAILLGSDYNHPYRRAIKKGLQDAPSQIIKTPAFNSPKIFADVYKTSIGSQIAYKSKGIIATPISPEFLQDFKIRIYYDIGIKKLPGQGANQQRSFSIIGAVTMVVENDMYYFKQSARVNDYGQVETTKGVLVRALIREAITEYLTERKLKAIDGPILLQRDGIYGVDEPGPALDEINTLRSEGFIPPGTAWAFIEFIKECPVRLFSHKVSMEPHRGTLFIFGPDRAFLTTTGTPDIHSTSQDEETAVGVAKTLEIRLVACSENKEEFIEIIAKDVYYRSFLWNATFSKTRKPVEANMVHELLDLLRQGVTQLPQWIC